MLVAFLWGTDVRTSRRTGGLTAELTTRAEDPLQLLLLWLCPLQLLAGLPLGLRGHGGEGRSGPTVRH